MPLLTHVLQVQEIRLDYTNCVDEAPDYNKGFGEMNATYVSAAFKSKDKVNPRWATKRGSVKLHSGINATTDLCYLRFTIPETMGAPVLFYYYLTNFYQNHRRYVDSFDTDQLKGDARTYQQIKDSKCDPLQVDEDVGKPYYPCGLIANSLFNDTFSTPVLQNPPDAKNDETRPYEMTTKGIAWESDRNLYGKTKYKPSDVLPPPNWEKAYPHGYTDEQPPPDLKNWEEFLNWMRTAGLPTFSKLAMRNNDEPMEKGEYEIMIGDCTWFGSTYGSVFFLLTMLQFSPPRSTRARSPFSSAPEPSWVAGILSLVLPTWLLAACVSFLAPSSLSPILSSQGLSYPLPSRRHRLTISPHRKLGDHTYLSWNNAPASNKQQGPSTAMASGRALPGEA